MVRPCTQFPPQPPPPATLCTTLHTEPKPRSYMQMRGQPCTQSLDASTSDELLHSWTRMVAIQHKLPGAVTSAHHPCRCLHRQATTWLERNKPSNQRARERMTSCMQSRMSTNTVIRGRLARTLRGKFANPPLRASSAFYTNKTSSYIHIYIYA